MKPDLLDSRASSCQLRPTNPTHPPVVQSQLPSCFSLPLATPAFHAAGLLTNRRARGVQAVLPLAYPPSRQSRKPLGPSRRLALQLLDSRASSYPTVVAVCVPPRTLPPPPPPPPHIHERLRHIADTVRVERVAVDTQQKTPTVTPPRLARTAAGCRQ